VKHEEGKRVMKYYKILNAYDYSCNGGVGKWHLPNGKRPGEWMPKIKDIRPCESGYHLCRKKDIIYWLGPVIWEAEGRGKKILSDNKVVFEQARLVRKLTNWNEKTQRLFAADCAEHVLKHWLAEYPDDNRPAKCIHAARDYANGLIDREALTAARDAAKDAAKDAAEEAAWAAWAAWAAKDTASDTAWTATSDTIWAATSAVALGTEATAWAATRAAERAWLTKRLFYYLNGGDDAI